MKRQAIKVAACALLASVCMAPAVLSGDFEAPGALAVEAESKSTSTVFEKSTQYPFSKIKSRVKKYKEVNKDVIGWLTVTGTNINEPVTFSDKDNNYYVARDWTGNNYNITYKNWNQVPATATYLDYRAKLGESWTKGTSRNLVLYGHNWNNLRETNLVVGNQPGYTMFAQLPSYVNKEFALQNPYIYFSTGDYEGVWKIFSVAYCELSPKFPYNSPNSSQEEFASLLGEWRSRSIHDFDTDLKSTDRILTLSTCTRQYNAGDYQRFVVAARLLREGESETDKVKIVDDGKFKKPNLKEY